MGGGGRPCEVATDPGPRQRLDGLRGAPRRRSAVADALAEPTRFAGLAGRQVQRGDPHPSRRPQRATSTAMVAVPAGLVSRPESDGIGRIAPRRTRRSAASGTQRGCRPDSVDRDGVLLETERPRHLRDPTATTARQADGGNVGTARGVGGRAGRVCSCAGIRGSGSGTCCDTHGHRSSPTVANRCAATTEADQSGGGIG